jgi:nucleoside-diphosphate-sugar epimerase
VSKIFITGGTGCIGASCIHKLFSDYHNQVDSVIVATRTGDPKLLKMWMGDSVDGLLADGKIKMVSVDIGDHDALRSSLLEHQPNRIIHLGAFQSPDCAAYPARGCEINVIGTLNLFNIAEELDPLDRFVFASSAAVYGKRAIYSGATVAESETLAPPNLYGVWKVAGEHLAALFQEKTNVPTVSLRLNTTFGPGRDRGKTSAPTVALKSIALGAKSGKSIPFQMPYGGRENYHYVEDVGSHFAGVCMLPFKGIGAYNIKGKTIEIQEFLNIAGQVATELGMGETVELGIVDNAEPNLFVCDLDHSEVEKNFPGLPRTEIETGSESR